MAVDGFDQAGDPIAALADQLADRLERRLAPRLARLAAAATPADGVATPELWSARRVATHYDVGVSFVYQHADELGAIRLGGGTCARLRFDPAVVRSRWTEVGGALPAERPRRQRSTRPRRHANKMHDENLLLEFDREP